MNKQNEYDLFYLIYSCENEILIVLMVIYFAIMWLQVLHSTVVKQLEIADLLEKLKESDCHVSIRAAFFFFSPYIKFIFPPSKNKFCSLLATSLTRPIGIMRLESIGSPGDYHS